LINGDNHRYIVQGYIICLYHIFNYFVMKSLEKCFQFRATQILSRVLSIGKVLYHCRIEYQWSLLFFDKFKSNLQRAVQYFIIPSFCNDYNNNDNSTDCLWMILYCHWSNGKVIHRLFVIIFEYINKYWLSMVIW